MPRRRIPPFLVAGAVLVALALAAGATVALWPASSQGPVAAPAGDCPAGFRAESGPEPQPTDAAATAYRPGASGGEAQRGVSGGEAEREAERERAGDKAACTSTKHPETFGELAKANGARDSRAVAPFTSIRPGALRTALNHLSTMHATVPGTAGTWSRLGSGPLKQDVLGYNEVNSLGLVDVMGRVTAFAQAPGGVLYAAVADGGLWKTTDVGDTWTSIGDKLPFQTLGAVGWTSGGGGTLIVITGDNAFGGSSAAGIGAYWSTNEGATWKRATGVPDGALGFKVAVDPTNANVVYGATSAGLWRSSDAGRTFTDVRLPTGPCVDKLLVPPCYFANIVTDVLVQSPDLFHHAGGNVLAAVGWRAGNAPDADGTPQAPANGIYTSPTGLVDTFARTADASFIPIDNIGRVELSSVEGPGQDHAVAYAIVEDAKKFRNGGVTLDVPEEVNPGALISTVLKGLYVTKDFGATWTEVVSVEKLILNPNNGSALEANAAIGYAPGVQAWYDLFVATDPTKQDANGVPTRVTFGLEEVWENDLNGSPVDGSDPTQMFHVIGRYFAGTTCQGFSLPLPDCPTNRPPHQSTTTHPDQHAGMFLSNVDGGVTLLVGNDGGFYRQTVGPTGDFDNGGWGGGNQNGFNTLLFYQAVMAKDGVAYGGLQDNGHVRIGADGSQTGVFGGDGFYAAVDPDNSDIAYEEYTGGAMSLTTDGGKTWRSVNPFLTNAAFATPFVMDPLDARHLMIGGRDIAETTFGPDTAKGVDPVSLIVQNDWVRVFDLGTQDEPGVAAATATAESPDNQLSAVDLNGDAAYVGYCGYCDVLTEGSPFLNGIATNVGGDKAPKKGTADGWHIAAADGLPNRIITSAHIDPFDPKTVYVTLAGYGRRWAPPGANQEDVGDVGTGHVFMSTDAGATFHSIDGNLPDIPANSIINRGGQLLVGTDIGVFLSSDLKGSQWQVLAGLPKVTVSSLQLKPGDQDTLVTGTFGRSAWTYRFASAPIPHPKAPAPGGSLPATGAVGSLLLLVALLVVAALALRALRHRADTPSP